MSTTRRSFVIGSMLAAGCAMAKAEHVPSPAPFGVLPAARHLRWQRMETNAFLHFTVNTFTDREWGNGDEDPALFNPAAFDADAIVQTLREAGMKGVILTCKHHDGFCLWPTQTTDHCIRKSPWRNGKGDVVREVAEAAKRHGLRFGVYLSPWDRNQPTYGTPAYIPLYRQQLTELLSNYGPVFEVWFDGANGGFGYYGGAREKRTIDKHTYYDWPGTIALVRKFQPQAVIFSDAGPDIRWVGNENGNANETCWATFDPVGERGGAAAPGDVLTSASMTGTRLGSRWMPAECDVSIRPGWFWHQKEDAQVKTVEQLLDLYFKSVGRGANLLLNIPPNPKGQLSEPDVQALLGFRKKLDQMQSENLASRARLDASNVRGSSRRFGAHLLVDGNPDTYWATDDTVHTPQLTLTLDRTRRFNVIRLSEAIQIGQRIASFAVDVEQDGNWREVAHATSVGACRYLRLNAPVECVKLRLRITDSPTPIALAEFGVYLLPA